MGVDRGGTAGARYAAGKARAPRQRALLERLGTGTRAARSSRISSRALRALARTRSGQPRAPPDRARAVEIARPAGRRLPQHSAQASTRSPRSLGGFAAHLLYGVTGSGKTEVYLQVIAAALGRRRPGAGARARNRADPAAGRAIRAPLQRRCRRAAFSPDTQLAARRLARRARRSRAHRHRHPFRRVHLAAKLA